MTGQGWWALARGTGSPKKDGMDSRSKRVKDREEKIRLLGFGPVLGIQAEESSKLRIGHGVEDTSRPAQGGGGNSQRSQSVA